MQPDYADADLALSSLSSDQFLAHLHGLGIELKAGDGKLLLNAPAGAVTVQLQHELRRRKPELIALLVAQESSEEERVAPLTYAQQRLWLMDRFAPGTAVYNIPQSWTIESDLDYNAAVAAIVALCARQPVLRTRIEVRDGEPKQVVLRHVDIPVKFTDLTDIMDEIERENHASSILESDGRGAFLLSHAPLIRFHILRMGSSRHIVSYNLHHIVGDQWSLDILQRDLAALYRQIAAGVEAVLPALTLTYADIAERERSDATMRMHNRQLEYWRERLKDMPDLLELPFSKPRPAEQGYEGANQQVELNAGLTRGIRHLATQSGSSLYLLMLTAFSVLLYRYTSERDMCIGTPITGRKLREEEELIGLFVNMLPLRCKVDPQESFLSLLMRMKQSVLLDVENGDIPFQRLVSELHPQRSSSHSPLFQIMFALNAKGVHQGDEEQRETFVGVSKFDLTLHMSERKHRMDAYLEYRKDLFEQDDIMRFGRHFVRLVESLVEQPDLPVGKLNLLTEEDEIAERAWNATAVPFDKHATLVSLFDKQVELNPDVVAVYHEQGPLSYSVLQRSAERLASLLRYKGAGPETFVGLCMERTPVLIVAMLGILKSGAAYLPLDPKYPEERLLYMLEDSSARILVADDSEFSRSIANAYPDLCVIYPGPDGLFFEAMASSGEVNEAAPAVAQNAAYLIYTSGSTGKPKGVVVEHRNAVALIAWAQTYFDPSWLRVMLASTSVCFDLSIFEIFLPLATGKSIVLVEDILQLPRSSYADRVTLINTVPSAMNALLHAGLPGNATTVCMAGELLPTELVDRVYAAGVERVFDLYGPTETTTYSTCALRAAGMPPTIGRPIGNTSIYLLDESLQQVPPGAAGEMFIGGAGVTRGYHQRPEVNRDRYLSIGTLDDGRPLYRSGDQARRLQSGELVYLGRRDQQIKLRGHRIELGEIESVLREISRAPQVAVVVAGSEGSEKLIAYIAGVAADPDTREKWMLTLRRRLPAYMVPAQMIALVTMPQTQNGKIDRKALVHLRDLKASSQAISKGEAPRDLLEQWIANIWSRQLGVEFVARDADFFDELGGHSLTAFEIFAEIEKRLGVALMLATLFQAPTVELLSVVVRRLPWKSLSNIEFVSPKGNSCGDDRVLYLVDTSMEAIPMHLKFAGERVMEIQGPVTLGNADEIAREIVTYEAGLPPLAIVGTERAHEALQRLAIALRNIGYREVTVTTCDPE